MATNHHQWGTKIGNNLEKISAGKFHVDGVDLIMVKCNVLNQCFDKFEKGNASDNVVGTSNVSFGFCGLQRHASTNFQFGVAPPQDKQMEKIDALNGINQIRQNDPFSQSYN